jgi:hypothetical protein
LTEFDVDPFEDIADEAVEPAPAKTAPAKKVAIKPSSDREGVTVTLKGGAGFDAPWIVIHAADLADAYEQVSGDNAGLLVKLMEQTSKAAQHFSGQNKGAGGAAPSNRAPAAAVAPPAGTPDAPGPDWTFKSGVGKTGKPWKAWMPPRGSDAQPVWL